MANELIKAEIAAKDKLKKQRRRYKIHYNLRKKGYQLNTSTKTVSVNEEEFKKNEYPRIISKYFDELIDLGYGIQSKLF